MQRYFGEGSVYSLLRSWSVKPLCRYVVSTHQDGENHEQNKDLHLDARDLYTPSLSARYVQSEPVVANSHRQELQDQEKLHILQIDFPEALLFSLPEQFWGSRRVEAH
jgi:hypothetical protein